ncbi:MAG: reverse transcriptase domain-containing protein [Bacilli bacterium]|nr:reverse transcriptase domain-containing protein [Bacilli bacterium]
MVKTGIQFIDSLSLDYNLNPKAVKNVIVFNQKFYRKVGIPKKDGSIREIYLPSSQIKLIHYYLIRTFLKSYEVSPFATAYQKGCSIKKNALLHTEGKHFFKTDITSFFESITEKKLVKFFCNNNINNISNKEIGYIIRSMVYDGKLIIGNPISPFVSNIFFKPIDDEIIAKLKESHGDCQYSRYSDDIVISSDNFIDKKIIEDLKIILSKYGLILNENKTMFLSRKNNIRITGINILDNKKLSVGTRYKKDLKKAIYNKINKKECLYTSNQILGKLYYLKDIEISYYNTLILKYSRKDKNLITELKEISLEETEF